MPRPIPLKPSALPPERPVWVVVADAGRARLFEAQRKNGGLVEIDDLINAQARVRDEDVVSDRPGRAPRGSDGVGRSFEPRKERIEQSEDDFARMVCARLTAGRRQGAVGRIYLLADPSFLGRLRQHLDAPTQRIVAGEQATDLTRRTPAVIRKALPKQL